MRDNSVGWETPSRFYITGKVSSHVQPPQIPGETFDLLPSDQNLPKNKYNRCNISRGSNEVISVEAGKTYRLRIINVAALSYLNFGVEGHSLTIVEADGTFVDPYKVDFLEINAGQRYSVLLTASQPPANYWINTQTKYRNLVLNILTFFFAFLFILILIFLPIFCVG